MKVIIIYKNKCLDLIANVKCVEVRKNELFLSFTNSESIACVELNTLSTYKVIED